MSSSWFSFSLSLSLFSLAFLVRYLELLSFLFLLASILSKSEAHCFHWSSRSSSHLRLYQSSTNIHELFVFICSGSSCYLMQQGMILWDAC